MIVDERMVAFINSFDKGNTPFLDVHTIVRPSNLYSSENVAFGSASFIFSTQEVKSS